MLAPLIPAWHRNSAALRALILALLLMPSYGRGEDLYLEVFVNGEPRNIISRFTDLGDGVLTADAQDLRKSGVLPGEDLSGEVRLDQIPGLGWRLITAEQTIRLIVPETGLAPHEVDARQEPGAGDELQPDGGTEAPGIDQGLGVVLNYGLSVSHWSDTGGATGRDLSGQFDLRFFTPVGALSHGFAAAPQQVGGHGLLRLDTYWRSSFPSRALQVQLGDIATRGPGWARPVRLGGLMIERNFGLRADIVTMPLAGFEGRADLPSTVEVYSGSLLAYSAEVPAGPFSIRDLPLASGSGVARVVLRDVTGKETQADLPFLVTDDLLRPGMADFALAAGRPRLGAGTESDSYVSGIFATATLRYGFSDGVTFSAHAEGGPDLAMGGLGASLRIGQIGTAHVSIAHSRTSEESGSLVDVASSLSVGKVRVSGRVMRTQGTFRDIAAQTADPLTAGIGGSDFPRQIGQVSLSLPLQKDAGANLFLSSIERTDGIVDRNFGASYSQAIGRQSSLTVSAAAVRGTRQDSVIGLSLHVPLGPRQSTGLSSEGSRGGWRHYVHAEGRSEGRSPGWNWRLQAERTDSPSIRGSAMYGGNLAEAEIAGRLHADGTSLGLRIEGAVVAAGGGVFMSRRIDDAFVVVDAGAPDIEVSAENRPVGRTGRSGKILVPDLKAWEDNKISLDPLGLPADEIVTATEKTVRPAYRSGAVVDFGVETGAQNALVKLVDQGGTPLEVGGRAVLLGRNDEFLIGFDGEIFLTRLAAVNTLEVTYPDGRRCRAEISHDANVNSITELREVPCS